MVEVKSTDTNPTKLPDVEPLCAGKIDTATTRCFDLLCVGKYEQGSDLKLNIQSADRVPNLVTKNANGNPVFTQSTPACTIRAPKGHNVWVKIDLDTITTNKTTAADYMCLGIKKQSEDDYFDILHMGNKSRYVDVLETDTVELVPLASSTPISTKYTAVKPGDTAKITGKNTYDFGSVFRVHVSLHDSQWLTEQTCNLVGIADHYWYNYGKMGIGPVMGQNGKVHKNQLVAIDCDSGLLAYSPDGAHWTENETVEDNCWATGPAYGNGIWCTVAYNTYGVRRSTDRGKTWSGTLANIDADCLNFANGIFMAISNTNPGIVYTSSDAEIWTQVGSVKFPSGSIRILIYGDNKWICGSLSGYIYQSKDGKIWEQISDGLYQINIKDSTTDFWYGGCHVNGYFYALRASGLIVRSSDGKDWKKVIDFSDITYYRNITYYKNKLWLFTHHGQKHAVGLFNPDGTIESLE